MPGKAWTAEETEAVARGERLDGRSLPAQYNKAVELRKRGVRVPYIERPFEPWEDDYILTCGESFATMAGVLNRARSSVWGRYRMLLRKCAHHEHISQGARVG